MRRFLGVLVFIMLASVSALFYCYNFVAYMTICIYPNYYKNEGKKIGIKSFPNEQTRKQLAQCGVLKYSKTYKTWYLPYEKVVFEKLKQQFPDLQILTDNAPIRTETAMFHQTDIANNLTTIVEDKTVAKSTTSLRIVADQEKRAWLVT